MSSLQPAAQPETEADEQDTPTIALEQPATTAPPSPLPDAAADADAPKTPSTAAAAPPVAGGIQSEFAHAALKK